jgi:hypothetical protein
LQFVAEVVALPHGDGAPATTLPDRNVCRSFGTPNFAARKI